MSLLNFKEPNNINSAKALHSFRYTVREFFNFYFKIMLKNILLVLLILLPAALYIYMVSGDKNAHPAEQKQPSSEQPSKAQ